MHSIACLLLVLSITFEGPTELSSPQAVRLDVSGFPTLNQDQLITQISQVLSTRFEVSAPSDSPVRITRRLFFDPAPDNQIGAALELTLELTEPGVYVILGPDMAYHRITIGNSTPITTPIPTTTTAAIYVYEKDQGSPPAAIGQAIHKLNQEHQIIALAVDQNTEVGSGLTQVAIKAAQSAGIPALVLLSNGLVTKIIRRPTTEAHVYEHVLPR